MTQFEPSRGGFVRAFGCAQFIVSFLKGEGPFGSTPIDPKRGAPQSDIFREYKEALRRELAEDLVALEEAKRIRRGQPPLTREEADALVARFIERLPLRSTRMRYHSFLSYFGLLKRLGWVEATGEQEISQAQDMMGGKVKREVQAPGPASLLAEKWSRAKKRNSAQALKDVEALPIEYDTEECKEALTDYRDLDPADFENREEYQEARDEAWERFLECLEDLVAEEEAIEEEGITTKPPVEKTGTPGKETGQPRIYYRITSAGYAAPKDLISDPVTALYNYPREVRSARAKA